MASETIEVRGQRLPVAERVDVLVCGGGPAGIAAAVAAGRAGARTLLVERAGFLGGTATGAMMALIVIPFAQLTGFAREFFARLAAHRGIGADGVVVPWDTEAYKLTAMEMVLECGAELLLYTWISDTIVRDGRVLGVVVENKSGRQALLADVVIDATGDADVAARAGVPFQLGRESDSAMRPVTVMGRFGNVDLPAFAAYIDSHPDDVVGDPGRNVLDFDTGIVRIDGFFAIVEEAKRRGIIDRDAPVNYLRFSGLVDPNLADRADVICNSTRVYGVDGTNARDLTRAEIEGRRQLQQIYAAVRELLPGFAHCTLTATSSYLGVRETRRIRGRYTLTYEDVAAGRRFDDALAVLASLDYGTAEIHGPEHGHEGSASDRWVQAMRLGMTAFELPARSLVPDGFTGLLTAGRCVSVTHEVDKFSRNMGPAALMGQAAGTLAAIIARDGADWDALPIERAQETLRRTGAHVHLDETAPLGATA
jgi:hypothetical protein